VLQANAIKQTALPTPTNRALDQLVKGYQLAINSTVLLAKENRQLYRENKRQKKKRAKRRAFIATRGILTLQEGLDRSQATNIVPESRQATEEVTIQRRAPCMCSLYRSLVHTARTCLTKQVSN
jgi:hypothetical protein